MGLALFGLKKNFFRPEKKEKARPFAQRKDFLRFRVGFCSKKNGNRRKKTSSPLPRSKNRGASRLALFASGNTRPRSATIIPAPRFGRGGGIAGVDDSALRQRADLQTLSAILLESWNESHRGMRTTRYMPGARPSEPGACSVHRPQLPLAALAEPARSAAAGDRPRGG